MEKKGCCQRTTLQHFCPQRATWLDERRRRTVQQLRSVYKMQPSASKLLLIIVHYRLRRSLVWRTACSEPASARWSNLCLREEITDSANDINDLRLRSCWMQARRELSSRAWAELWCGSGLTVVWDLGPKGKNGRKDKPNCDGSNEK